MGRPVRVNLPKELGGGHTVVMCFMDSGQLVADFIKNLVAMLQNTNSYGQIRNIIIMTDDR